MSTPMPDDDPLDGVEVPPACSRYPTCEGYLIPDFEDDPLHPYDCTWPDCSTPPTKGTPTP